MVIPIVAAVCLALSHYHGSVAQWRVVALHLPRLGEFGAIAPFVYWFAASVVLYLVVPLATLLLLREPLCEYGWGLGRWRLGLALSTVLLLVLLPGAVALSQSPTFSEFYPLARGASRSASVFLVYEAAYLAYFVAWEHLFRSFLLFGLYRRIGSYSVYVATIPFVVLHLGKPEIETYVSLVAGIALGYLALTTRSFWWCVFVHGSVAVTMDVCAVWL